MKKGLLFILLVPFISTSSGQNLVPNPSFETFTTCPNALIQISYAFPWDMPAGHNGSADYFNTCSNPLSNTFVPGNIIGYQFPATGNGYAGVITYFVLTPSSTSAYREYITAPLNSTLIAGHVYGVSFKVNISELIYRCASDAIQLNLSVGPPVVLPTSAIIPTSTPLIGNPQGNILSDTTQWITISGTYTAIGGESHVTIGNFLTNAQTTVSCAPGIGTVQAVYFFVDDVEVIELPFMIVGPDTVCAGDSVVLHAINDSLHWWADATLPNDTLGTDSFLVVSPSVTTTYICHTGSNAVDSHTVVVQQPPVVNLGPDTIFCGNAFSLNAGNPGMNYNWSTGDSTQTIIVTQSGTYWATVTSNGSCSASDSVTITLHTVPIVNLGPDTFVCDPMVVLYSGNPSYSHLWSIGSQSNLLAITQSGVYSVIVNNNGCLAYDTISLTFYPKPLVNLGPDTTMCGGFISLNAGNPGMQYNWSNTMTTQQITIAQSGSYYVTVTDTTGCLAADTILINILNVPVANLGPDTTLCDSSFLLNAGTPGYSYLWSTGDTTQTIIINQSDTFSVVIDNSGCTDEDSVIITLEPVPYVHLGSDTFFCEGDLLLDAGNPGATYLWSGGGTSQTQLASATGTYSVMVTLGNCSDYDSLIVTIGPNPEVDLGPDTMICAEQLFLDAGNPGAIYVWQDNSTAQQLNVTQSGIYYVTVSYGICVEHDTVDIMLSDPIPFFELGRDTALCGGEMVLTAGGSGFSYLWSTGDTTRQITVSNSGTYWATVSSDLCDRSDTISLQIHDIPEFDLGPDRLICIDEQANLYAYHPGATYLWSTGGTVNVYTITEPGLYWAEARLGPCKFRDTVRITRAISPQVTQAGSLCEDGQVVLDAGDVRGTIIWSHTEDENPVIVKDPGTYVVVVEEGHCRMEMSTVVDGEFPSGPYLPNAFMPDGNGRNDLFPGTFRTDISFKLEIYNRWGERIFISEDNSDWDGTYQNEEAPSGIYLYRVSYQSECEGEQEVSGHVMLVR